MFKKLGKFLSVALLLGLSFYAGRETTNNKHARALQGCEVVASQAIKDKEAEENSLYETINYFQTRLRVCDELMTFIQDLNTGN